MKLTNVLTKKETTLEDSELITQEEKSQDYIISIPHSGEFIPSSLLNKFNLGHSILIGSDLHTDKVFNLNSGITLSTKLSSSFVNVSRFKDRNPNPKLPLSFQTSCYEVNSLTDEKIRTQDYTQSDINLAFKYYDLYHNKIKETLEKLKQTRKEVLILDGHSMASVALKNTPDYGKNDRPDFNIGTLDDTSASKEIIETFTQTLEKEASKHNLTVQKNSPYKGGVITKLYGQPSKNIHCIQLEVKKKLFMDESLQKGDFTFYPEKAEKIKNILQTTIEKTKPLL
jgi:N-formylglutamate deformylase